MTRAHVSKEKKEVVKTVLKLASENPIIGAVNMENLPAKQLQNMRQQLRGKVTILMTKRRLMKVAFSQLKGKIDGIEELSECLNGMPALIFTKENPFSLFRILKKNKSKAPAKAGQKAVSDIIIPAGPTPFAPGPVIGELGSLGVKTQVDKGKIAVVKDTVACREGAEISQKLAEMLTRLNILPMEVGLDLSAILEKGVIYKKQVLDIDEDRFKADMATAARWAFNLAVEITYPQKDVLEAVITKAARQARALSMESKFPTAETMADLMALAQCQMLSLKEAAHIE